MTNWVQGTSVAKTTLGHETMMATLTVAGGDALIVSVGMRGYDLSNSKLLVDLAISDNQNNVWLLVCVSPIQQTQTPSTVITQVATFIATNCAAGSTTVSVGTLYATVSAITFDEYSGVSSARAVDGVTFSSTVPGSSVSSVNSGTINIHGTEMVYSAGFADLDSETFTPSLGFTQRQEINTTLSGFGISLASFDKSFTGGTASNTVSVSVAPDSLHVTLLALSSTPVPSPIVQTAWAVASSITGTYVEITYPFSVTAGNLLILAARVYERGGFTVTDTQSNVWTVIEKPDHTEPNIVMAFCAGCAAGTTTVHLEGTTGGDDISFAVIIAEYVAPGATYTGFSWGQALPGGTVDTGTVAVATIPSLLISSMVAISSGPTFVSLDPVPSTPGIRRYQLSDGGFFNEALSAVVLSDQTEYSLGSYGNVFNPSSASDELYAIILGFSLTATLSLACPLDNTGQIGVEYFSSLVAFGGTPPYTFSIIGGLLPPNLTLDPSTGIISGIPTTEGVYLYQPQVMDSVGSTATVTCEIGISAIPLPTAPFRCANVMPTGPLYTLEVTRDLDADWDDESTFWIIQDVPLPFTLRGLVMRLSYNPD